MTVDRELFREAVEGEREAFWRLIMPFRGLVYSIARAMVQTSDEAEDGMHDVLVLAFRNLHTLRDPDRLAAWLYSLTRNHVADNMRRERRIRRAAQEKILADGPRVVSVTALDEKEEWFQRMEAALADLPEPFRLILGMKYTNNYSCQEISEILDISISATRSRLYQARRQLRRRMEALAEETQKETDHGVS